MRLKAFIMSRNNAVVSVRWQPAPVMLSTSLISWWVASLETSWIITTSQVRWPRVRGCTSILKTFNVEGRRLIVWSSRDCSREKNYFPASESRSCCLSSISQKISQFETNIELSNHEQPFLFRKALETGVGSTVRTGCISRFQLGHLRRHRFLYVV